ncbi:NAD(P)H-binding protein [Nocardioidaceae bacterium SCSIO 66511]|nr:NAD(P)H-binding protein [Nocardioidaceae bacterium SCSIO 66511]
MTNTIVFGAGGRAGREVVAEAARRGHRVTAVVRNPATYDRPSADVRVEHGDVTDPGQTKGLAVGHDAAVSAVARLDVPAVDFYTAATTALIHGLNAAGTKRLVVVGIGTNLRTTDGRRVHDADGLPDEARAFSRGHLAGVQLLANEAAALDWVVLAPPPVLLDEPDGGGPVVLGDDAVPDPTQTADSFSYPEVARAVIDQIEAPSRHRELVSIARVRSAG